MTVGRRIAILMAVLVGASVGARAQQPPAASPPLKIGTRVGGPEKSGYDAGGRRDPFAGLIAEKAPAAASGAPEPGVVRAKGLAGVAIVDARVTGIIANGESLLAIVAGPDGAMYLAHADDRLHDGVVRRIDRDAVVFLAQVPDGTGRIVSREVRKGLRPGTGDGR